MLLKRLRYILKKYFKINSNKFVREFFDKIGQKMCETSGFGVLGSVKTGNIALEIRKNFVFAIRKWAIYWNW